MHMRRFIVGVDGSLPARAATRWAIAHAREHEAEVRLVLVADDEWGVVGTGLIDEVDEDARQRLDGELRFARALASDLPISGELRSGSPMVVLASLSDADVMVVVGTHKTGFHYGRAFGSRSLQLANLAAGPVAVVPEAESRLRRGVVVGLDDTVAGGAALDVAADLACDHHCELIIVRSSHATEPFRTDRDDEAQDWQLRRDDVARGLLATAIERVRRRQRDINVRARVVRRPPGIALNEIARSAELLVIGDSRREAPQPGALGSVAYDVLLNLSSPTIIVHAPAVVDAGVRQEGEHHAVG
ncbi:universal stress protein [Leifsonia poae]|uniref:universal stress protein n=1 Tax=Leifsonia poae TaxID=110933 RepID=UPI003D6891AE